MGTREFIPCPANLLSKAYPSLPAIHKLNGGGQISRKKLHSLLAACNILGWTAILKVISLGKGIIKPAGF